MARSPSQLTGKGRRRSANQDRLKLYTPFRLLTRVNKPDLWIDWGNQPGTGGQTAKLPAGRNTLCSSVSNGIKGTIGAGEEAGAATDFQDSLSPQIIDTF